jgi:hypothetical protein
MECFQKIPNDDQNVKNVEEIHTIGLPDEQRRAKPSVKP